MWLFTIGVAGEEKALRNQAAPLRVIGDSHLSELPAFDTINAVKLREVLVEHGEVGGHQVHYAHVLLQDFGKEQTGFPEHVVPDETVEARELPGIHLGVRHLLRLQPLIAEGSDKVPRPRILDHAIYLIRQIVPELLLLSEL